MVDLLARVAKHPSSFDRSRSADDALAIAERLRERFGITAVRAITDLDRVGIPVVSAVVPKSADAISVYNGKGTTLADARIGAIMEAIERQVAAAFDPPVVAVPACDVQEDLDLRALRLFDRHASASLPCVRAVDLIGGKSVYVPIAAVRTPWYGEPTFPTSHTNGLAAGFSPVEALYHALCEVVERHTWSVNNALARSMRSLAAGSFESSRAREVILPTGEERIDALIESFERAGMRVRLLALCERELPVTLHASIFADDDDAVPFAFGIGTSLSPMHAAIRALTEAAQSRLVDIQGAREDITRGSTPRERWYGDAPAAKIPFVELPDRSGDDLASDARTVIATLRDAGARTIAVVDLSPSDAPLNVVRIVAPELSSAMVDGRVGTILRDRMNDAMAGLSSFRVD